MPSEAPGPVSDWKPNLFVPGFPKCGTTALCDYLRQHPDIYVMDPKEPKTLSIGLSEPAWGRKHHEVRRPFYRYLTPGAYRRQLEEHRDSRYRAEGSQTYVVPPYFPKRLKAFAPDAKLIFMVREQKERLLSLYSFMFKRHKRSNFREWAEQCFLPEIGPFLYAEILRSYHSLYGDSMRVIDNNSLLESPKRVMAEAFAFLGLGEANVSPTRSNVGGLRALDEFQRSSLSPYLKVTQTVMMPWNYFMNIVDPAGKVESKVSVGRVNPIGWYKGHIVRGGPTPSPKHHGGEGELTIPPKLAVRLDEDYGTALDFCRDRSLLLGGSPGDRSTVA